MSQWRRFFLTHSESGAQLCIKEGNISIDKNKGTDNMKKRKIRTSLLAMTIVLVILLSIALAIAGFNIYRSNMIERYQNYAGDSIECIARCIDGDDLEKCIETGKKSEKYEELQTLANNFKESHDLIYIYIIKPLKIDPPHNMMDVLAAYTAWEKANEADTMTDLGVITEYTYPTEVAEQYMARMDNDPTITYFRNDTDFGDIYTAIRPIFNSKGEPIAVLCADIEINEIYDAAEKYALSAMLISLVFFAFSLLFVNLWIGRRIVKPIQKLQDASKAFEDKCRKRADVEDLVMRDPEIHTQDEIEGLSDSIISMVEDVQNYARDLVRKEEEISRKDTEILSMKEYVSQMDELAYRDPLTGAGNKAAYEKAARKLDWDILAGTADFAIIMSDLNYLKRINDSYGHDKGNVYIKGMYDIVAENFADSPIFRIGGDEFVVIVQNGELEKCEALVDSIRERMDKTMRDASLEPWERISTSFGIGRYEDGDDVDAVFKKADIAMYDEKKRMHAER